MKTMQRQLFERKGEMTIIICPGCGAELEPGDLTEVMIRAKLTSVGRSMCPQCYALLIIEIERGVVTKVTQPAIEEEAFVHYLREWTGE
jgi:hypothetical protein